MTVPADPTVQESVDLMALNREGQVVLLVQVDAKQIGEDRGQQINARTLPIVPYFIRNCLIDQVAPIYPDSLIAYLDWIEIYRNRLEFVGEHQFDRFLGADLLCALKTEDVLSRYDPEFPTKRVYGTYLTTLVQVWLDDLAFHWKTDNPPGSQELAEHGLLHRLEGGSIRYGSEDR